MNFIKAAEANLSAEDKKFLSDIYAPKEVVIPDENPGFGILTPTPEGYLRIYGEYGRKNVFENAEDVPHVYLESRDCGLSWKRHFSHQPAFAWRVYVPFLDRYLASYNNEAGGEASIAILKDLDDESPEMIPLGEEYRLCPAIVPLKKRNRVVIVEQENRFDLHPTAKFPVVLVTDDGKTFRRTKIDPAPFAEKKWPHKGYRWQQNLCETTVAELDDGTLMLVSRTALDEHYVCYSYDGGETFTAPEPSIFHATTTMPKFLSLSDGRLLMFYCNTRPLPELAEADGVWEDVFTNRDASHIAISEDGGKSFFGFRELALNPFRANTDFRSLGGMKQCLDKSVHQFEAIELPLGKVLVLGGQHELLRRGYIFDPAWLYEKERRENFTFGFGHISTQVFLTSVIANYSAPNAEVADEYSGHCAYNRLASCKMLPSPEDPVKECLFLASGTDPYLLNKLSGAVWNFPAAKRGEVKIRMIPSKSGVRVSLLDVFMNPADDTVAYFADGSVVLRRDMTERDDVFTTFVLRFDCEAGKLEVSAGDYFRYEMPLRGADKSGLSYLHVQTATETDLEGTYIAEFSFRKLD